MEHILRLELEQHPLDPDINKHQLKIMLEIAQFHNMPYITVLGDPFEPHGGNQTVRGYREDNLRELAHEIGVTEDEVLEAFHLFKGVRVRMENTYSKTFDRYPYESEITERITMNLLSCGEIDPDARDYDEDFPEPSGCFEVHDYIYCYNASIFDYTHLTYEDMVKMIDAIGTNGTFNRLEAQFRECVGFRKTNLIGERMHELIGVRVWQEKT